MANPFFALRKLLRRWGRQQETALWQMSGRKMVGQRVAGVSKSERIEAKFFLLAMAPFAPLIMSDQFGWPRGQTWHVWFWLSAVWAIATVAIGFAAILRALRRSMRRKP